MTNPSVSLRLARPLFGRQYLKSRTERLDVPREIQMNIQPERVGAQSRHEHGNTEPGAIGSHVSRRRPSPGEVRERPTSRQNRERSSA